MLQETRKNTDESNVQTFQLRLKLAFFNKPKLQQ